MKLPVYDFMCSTRKVIAYLVFPTKPALVPVGRCVRDDVVSLLLRVLKRR